MKLNASPEKCENVACIVLHGAKAPRLSRIQKTFLGRTRIVLTALDAFSTSAGGVRIDVVHYSRSPHFTERPRSARSIITLPIPPNRCRTPFSRVERCLYRISTFFPILGGDYAEGAGGW